MSRSDIASGERADWCWGCDAALLNTGRGGCCGDGGSPGEGRLIGRCGGEAGGPIPDIVIGGLLVRLGGIFQCSLGSVMSGAVVEGGSSAAAVGFPKRPTKKEEQGGRTETECPQSIFTSSFAGQAFQVEAVAVRLTGRWSSPKFRCIAGQVRRRAWRLGHRLLLVVGPDGRVVLEVVQQSQRAACT